MKILSLIFLTIIGLSCESSQNDGIYNIPNIQENIKAFAEARKCFPRENNILLVILEHKDDTMVVSLSDTYPKIKTMKCNYDTVLYEHRIIFVGEKIKGFSTNSSPSRFQPDIMEKSLSKEWPNTEEFTTWFYFYKDEKLVYKDTPCVE